MNLNPQRDGGTVIGIAVVVCISYLFITDAPDFGSVAVWVGLIAAALIALVLGLVALYAPIWYFNRKYPSEGGPSLSAPSGASSWPSESAEHASMSPRTTQGGVYGFKNSR
jgi:hypothetical protein